MSGTAASSKNKPIVLLCGVAVATAAYLLLSHGKSNKGEKDVFQEEKNQNRGNENVLVPPTAVPVGSGNPDTPKSIDSSTESSKKDSPAKRGNSQADEINESEKFDPVSPTEIKESEEAKGVQPGESASVSAKTGEVEDEKFEAPVPSPTETVEEAEVVEQEEVASTPTKTEVLEEKVVEEPTTETVEAIEAIKKVKELVPSQTMTAEVIESLKEDADAIEQEEIASTSANAGETSEELAPSSTETEKATEMVCDEAEVLEKEELLSPPVSERKPEVKDKVFEEEPVKEGKVEENLSEKEDRAPIETVEVAIEIAGNASETLLPNEVLAPPTTKQDGAGVEPLLGRTFEETSSSSGYVMTLGDVQAVIKAEVPDEGTIVRENQNPAPPNPEYGETQIEDVLDLEEKDKEAPSTVEVPASSSKKKKRRRKKKKNGATVASGDDGVGTIQNNPTPTNTDENINTDNQVSTAQNPNSGVDANTSASAIAAKKALKNKRKRENRKKKNKTTAHTAAVKEIQDFQKSQENKLKGTQS